MDKLVFTTLNGMKTVEQRQSVTYNELANVSTVGFKKTTSPGMIYRDLVAQDQLDTRTFPVVLGDNIIDLTPGAMQQTGGDLDFYISGKGLFGVQGSDGNEAYTRRGDMKLTANGLLTTGAGDLVLGDNGPITIPPSQSIDVSPDGTIRAILLGDPTFTPVEIDRLKLVNAENVPMKLRPDGLYNAVSNEILEPDAAITLTKGALEGSAVSPVEAMVQMIKDAREYEMHVRVIRNAKELSTSTSNMLRLDS